LINWYNLSTPSGDHSLYASMINSPLLVGIGVYTLFFKKVLTDEGNNIAIKEYGHWHFLAFFLSGFFMNILNPAVFIFWIVWTTAITADAQTAAHPLEYRFIVFVTCLAFVLLTDILKVKLAGRLRSKLTPKILNTINKISGLILIGFGIALCWGILAYGDKLK